MFIKEKKKWPKENGHCNHHTQHRFINLLGFSFHLVNFLQIRTEYHRNRNDNSDDNIQFKEC